jgi:hypothetical protein
MSPILWPMSPTGIEIFLSFLYHFRDHKYFPRGP